MLEEGRGGFNDFHKYREAMTGIFWNLDAEQLAPDDALAEARKLREQMMAQPEPDE